MNINHSLPGPGWLRLLRPWTTPLEPQALLRTRIPAAPSPARPSATPRPDTEPAGRASVTWNSRRFEADGDDHESILELLERNGEQPRFGCRRGVCRRCIVPLHSGRVRDMRDGRDIDAGTHVRICVTAPLNDAEMDGSEQPVRSGRADAVVA